LKEVSEMVSSGTIKDYEKIIRRAEKEIIKNKCFPVFLILNTKTVIQIL
jgi:hypothetical protein